MHASLKLEVIDGRAQPGVEHAAYFDSTRGNLLVHIEFGRVYSIVSHIAWFGGACSFFVGGLSCQVYFDNERDFYCKNVLVIVLCPPVVLLCNLLM